MPMNNLDELAKREDFYYMLATAYGEEKAVGGGFTGGRLEVINRRIWNGLMARYMSDADKDRCAIDLGVERSELDPLNDDEIDILAKRFSDRGIKINGFPKALSQLHVDKIHFSNFTLGKQLNLKRRVFPVYTSFQNFACEGNFSVERSLFHGASFNGATFKGFTYFMQSKFGYRLERKIGFANPCDFVNCKFLRGASFSKAELTNGNFTSATFKEGVNFWGVRFSGSCPRFFDADLPENSMFSLDSDSWSSPSQWSAERARFGRHSDKFMELVDRERMAFLALKRRMEEMKRPEEAEFFSRMELGLKAKGVGLDCIIANAYCILSGYGGSVGKPLSHLAASIVFGAAIYSGHFHVAGLTGSFAEDQVFASLGISFSSTFNFLGLGKLFFSDEMSAFPAMLVFVSGCQTVFGVILTFLLGLGLRNRFRLK